MKKITIILMLIASFQIYTQNPSVGNNSEMQAQKIEEQVQKLENENKKLKTLVNDMDMKLKRINSKVKQITEKTDSTNNTLNQATSKLGLQISNTESAANSKIQAVDENLSKNSLYGIIAVLLTFIFVVLTYFIVNKKLSIGKTELIDKIKNTKSELDKEGTKLDMQLLELIEKQLRVADKISKIESTTDHTFHKNSANEMQKIANYVNTLDIDSQEAIALNGSLERLRNYFNSSEYEIIEFRNIDFDDRIPMRVKETNYDESLPKGKEIITRTLKPQIKYKGQVIQDPEVITKYNN